MITHRAIDLNIFFREEWDEKHGAYISDKLFVDVYDYWHYRYENGDTGSDHAEVGILIECTPEETRLLRRAYPEFEYGYDWWVHYDEAVLPVTLHEKLKSKLANVLVPMVR